MSLSIVQPGEQLWPEEYYGPKLGKDHCRDVLEGSYDVPVEFGTPPTILDLGANVGAFARWAVKRWPGAEIDCYEPNPDNFKLLSKTWVTLPWVHVHNQAVLNKEGRMFLHDGPINCGECSLHTKVEGGTEVEVIPASSLPKADILKMDVEGSELVILSDLDKANRLGEFRAIMLEYHDYNAGLTIIQHLLAKGFYLVGWRAMAQHRGEIKFIRPQ